MCTGLYRISDNASANLRLQMMGARGYFGRNIIRKRQAVGIAKTRANKR